MDCTQIERLIPLYIGGDLEPGRERDLRRHIETCAHCRELAAEFEESRDWMRNLAAPQFDAAILDDLREAIHREIRSADATSLRSESVISSILNKIFPFSTAVMGRFDFRNMGKVTASLLTAALLVAMLAVYVLQHRRHRLPVSQNATQTAVQEATKTKKKTEETKPDMPNPPDLIAETGSASRTYRRPRLQRGDDRPVNPASPSIAGQTEMPDPEPMAPAEGTAEATIEEESGAGSQTGPEIDRQMLRIEIQTADPNIRIIWLVARSTSPSAIKFDGKSESSIREEDGGPK